MKFFNKIKTFFKNKFSNKSKDDSSIIENDTIQELSIIKNEIDNTIHDTSILNYNNIDEQKDYNENNQDSLNNKKTTKKKTKTIKKKNINNKNNQEEQNIVQKIYNVKNPKYDKIVIFLTPGHTNKTPGKHSPDGRLYEWKYNRLIVSKIEQKLDELGIEHWNSHPEDSWVDKAHNNDNKDLQLRVQRINKKYEEFKKQGKTAIMLSIHVNAAGLGTSWMNATGWSAWTTKGQNNSDKLADCLYEAATELLKPWGKKLLYDLTDGDKDYESNFYVIKHVNCIAVLTENFFMDNMNDVDWLLSFQGQEYISLVHIEGIKKFIEKYIK